MKKQTLLAALLSGSAVALAGCGQEPDNAGADTAGTEETRPAASDPQQQSPAGDARLAESGEKHDATGTVESVDMQNGSVTINHEPVESAELPAMTMPFAVEDPALLEGIENGTEVRFTFSEGQAGEYVIEDISEER